MQCLKLISRPGCEKIDGELADNPLDFEGVIALQSKPHAKILEITKTENLYEYNGKRGCSLGQGEWIVRFLYCQSETKVSPLLGSTF